MTPEVLHAQITRAYAEERLRGRGWRVVLRTWLAFRHGFGPELRQRVRVAIHIAKKFKQGEKYVKTQ
jgi:hypothetical protein